MITTTRPLGQATQDFDRASIREHLERAEASREEILKRFPIAKWPEMTLEEYALGHEESEDAFCRWLEYRSPEIGSIKGGSARKHVIFKFKDGTWWHPSMFENERIAWEHLRADFVKAFELAGEGKWNDIADLETLRWAPALTLKALYIYFPSEIIPIFSTAHLRHFLTALDAPLGEHHIEANRNLLAALQAMPQLEGWSTNEMMWLLYKWNDPKESHRVRKVAPGEDAKWWQDCLAGGYICVGWDEIVDLSQFDGWQDLARRYQEVYPDRGKANASLKAKELWMFRELEAGDVVVANHGRSKVLAIGTVQEPGYRWDPSRDEAKHTVAVEWDTSYSGEIPYQGRWAFVTVANVPGALYKKILTLAKEKPGPTPPVIPVDELYQRIAKSLERKGQLILYGPPGTGKTYAARSFAVWWLNHRAGRPDAGAILADQEEFARAEKVLSTTQVRSQVWWVVANPSYWKWDNLFKDGSIEFGFGRVKHNYSLVQPGDLVIGYEGTPTKRIVALATVSRGLGPGDGGEITIELKPLVRVQNGPSFEELQNDPVLKSSQPLRNTCQGTLFELTEDEADHLLGQMVEQDSQVAKVLGQSLSAGPTGIGQLTRVSFHPSYAYEDFIEGFRPLESSDGDLILRLEDGLFKRVCRAAQADPNRPYLMLIDEFNRANVAKVLGELITLLENDKRGLTITLPQSEETFAVPANVYLLGTMNTADRSIKLLDAALRRRFAFKELMPDTEMLSGAKVGDLDLGSFLEALNERIAKTEGREKQIGHAYLLSDGKPVDDVEEFAALFREEILPLLQEYCYDEYHTLAEFIGPDLVKAESQMLDVEILYDAERLVEALAGHLISQGEAEA